MAKRNELLALFDLADSKGFDVTKGVLRNHVRLIDPDGKTIKRESGSAAFSRVEARRYLEGLPDRTS
jgi:hypothetical protein